MTEIRLPAAAHTATLFPSDTPGSPLIVLHSFLDDSREVRASLTESGAPDCSLLVLSGMRWTEELSPWKSPALSPKDPPFTGGADDYLAELTEEILPLARSRLEEAPSFCGIAGYSLAGLFALYSLTRCDWFSRAASMSGSLWYPGLEEYLTKTPFVQTPDRLYLSLGDREERTKHETLRTVREKTERLRDHYRAQGIEVRWELNPGNHFRDPVSRTVKGIRALLD